MSQDNITITIEEIVERINVSVESSTENIFVNIIDETQTISVQVSELGEPGLQGKSIYDIAVDNGFIGTQSEWLQDFKNEIIAGVLSSMSLQKNDDDYTNNELTKFIFNHQERIEELLNAMSLTS